MSIILFIISIIASTIGAITGIGGGIIVKPVVDSIGVLPISVTAFLSGCMVLSMSFVSLIKGRESNIKIDVKQAAFLAVGAAIGGILGKVIFDFVKNSFEDEKILVISQSGVLCFLTISVLIYMICKDKVATYNVKGRIIVTCSGLFLGLVSAFLGIGGGPINLVVLYMLFSMDTKEATLNSIYIIFLSQLTNLVYSLCIGNVPNFEISNLIVMIIGGISGGLIGSEILKRITGTNVNKIFNALLIIIIVICLFNVWRCF